MKTKQKQPKVLKQILKYIKPYSFYLVLSLVLAVVVVGLTLYIPILTGDAIDLIVGKGNVDFAKIIDIMIAIGICMVITAIAQWVMSICNNRITYGVVRDIRNDAFEKLEIVPLKYIDGNSSDE